MRVFYEHLGVDIEITEGINGICIENPCDLRDICDDFWKQENGEEGNIFFSKEGKAINWNKGVCGIWNPFSIDINERKILGKVYNMLEQIADVEYYENSQKLNSQIVEYLDLLEKQLPFPLAYDLKADYTQLFKIYNLKIDMQSVSLLERIINYIKLCHQILNVDIFIMFNVSQYLTEEDWDNLNQMIAYEQVSLLFIENNLPNQKISGTWWIIDRDKCIIEIQ